MMNLPLNTIGQGLKRVLQRVSKGRLPQIDGRIYLDGLQAAVRVERDKWGIPHISAETRLDLLFAQGYVHAQDRLWQMETQRLAANGQVSTALGPVGLATDRFSRTLGFRRGAQAIWDNLEAKTQADLTAYTAGINAFLERENKLPVEFTVISHTPAAWDVLDVVAFSRLQGWSLTFGWAGTLLRAQLIEQLGADVAALLDPAYPDDHPLTLPDGIDFNKLGEDGVLQAVVGPFLYKANHGDGSNAWVISAENSSTGHALIANDMHLPITTPAIWYMCHLRSTQDSLNVSGVSIPGMPSIIVGHNTHIAWGATLAYTDCEDIFVEQAHPDDPTRFLFGDEWEQATVIEETIEVRGRKQAHVEKVVITRHGPLISNLMGNATEQHLALSSMPLQQPPAFEGFQGINEAANWDEFVTAVEKIASPPLNLLYADVADNIGHYVTGRVPIRKNGRGLLPSPGWTGEYDWIGIVPFAAMPHALNPKRGFIISANNKLVADDYPYNLGMIWNNGYRARRIEALFAEGGKWSQQRCMEAQGDVMSISAEDLIGQLHGLKTTNPDALLALALIRDWDREATEASIGTCIYHALYLQLTRTLLQPTLDDNLLQRLLGSGDHPWLTPYTEFAGYWVVTLIRLLKQPQLPWLAPAKRDETLIDCLAGAVKWLKAELGDDPAEWRWGDLHTITFNHHLGAQSPLDTVFNLGPYPVYGNSNTVCQVDVGLFPPFHSNGTSVSFRFNIDMGAMEKAQGMFAPGQSGHLASPHYSDLVEPWLNHEHFPMTWVEGSAEAEQAEEKHTLTLSPPPSHKKTEPSE